MRDGSDTGIVLFKLLLHWQSGSSDLFPMLCSLYRHVHVSASMHIHYSYAVAFVVNRSETINMPILDVLHV